MILNEPLTWVAVVLIAPVVGGLFSLVPRARVYETAARATAVAMAIAAVALLVLSADVQWGPYLGVDELSDVFLFIITTVYATTVWYSRNYLQSVSRPFLTPRTYYGLLAAFAFAMVATLVTSDLGLMWIGIEATTVASALLIVLQRTPSTVEAAWRYTLIASAGLTIALFGLLLVYSATGTLNIFDLAKNPPVVSEPLEIAVALALVGYGTKIGLFPMHTWLPDAHSEAPSPVSALFSAVLLPTALYAFLRVYRILPAPPPETVVALVLAFGLATVFVAAFLVLRQRSYKRLLAYSSMEVMGLAVVGVALGGVAVYGALILLVAHAFAKSSAFYCAGNVLQRTGTSRIDGVGDLRGSMPWTATGWFLAALAVTGAPPFGTFVGELLIVAGAVAVGWIWLAVLVVVGILVAFVGINGQIGRMVFGPYPGPDAPPRTKPERGVGVVYLNLAIALALGVASLPFLTSAIQTAATILGGSIP